MGGLAGGGGGGGGMMQIEVTPEDEEAISRLMALGFPRGAAIQAFPLTMQCIMQRAVSASNAPPFRHFLACDILHYTPLTHCRPSWRATRTRTSLPTSSSTKGTTSSRACAPAAQAVGWSGVGRRGGGGGGRQAGGGGLGEGVLAARCRMMRLSPLQHCASTYFESACRSRVRVCEGQLHSTCPYRVCPGMFARVTWLSRAGTFLLVPA